MTDDDREGHDDAGSPIEQITHKMSQEIVSYLGNQIQDSTEMLSTLYKILQCTQQKVSHHQQASDTILPFLQHMQLKYERKESTHARIVLIHQVHEELAELESFTDDLERYTVELNDMARDM